AQLETGNIGTGNTSSLATFYPALRSRRISEAAARTDVARAPSPLQQGRGGHIVRAWFCDCLM
ncbi:MAG: hypothetical protein IKS36_00695, partial [Bacteroidales bacterium]|nr:hypothetical protein [Bacteroidales bacterium]